MGTMRTKGWLEFHKRLDFAQFAISLFLKSLRDNKDHHNANE